MSTTALLAPAGAIPSPLIDFIKRWEGCSLVEYVDLNGVPTCGWGHANPQGTPWTQEQADAVLMDDVERTRAAIRQFMTREPSPQQWDALTSIAYNCGVSAIGNSGLMSRFNADDDQRCLSRWLLWDRAGGREVPGLLKRRQAECRIFTDGDYSGGP